MKDEYNIWKNANSRWKRVALSATIDFNQEGSEKVSAG